MKKIIFSLIFTLTCGLGYPQKSIIIGDSQSNYIALNSKEATLYLPLYKVGIGLSGLNKLVTKNTVKAETKFVFISIGVNDNYKYLNIGFEKNLKRVFPNAKFYLVQGSYGWGNAKHFNYNYYKNFNFSIISPGIGYGDPHKNKESYRLIGKKIDYIIKNE